MSPARVWSLATAAALAAVVFAQPADAQRQRRLSLSDRMELIEQRMAALESAGQDEEARQAMADMFSAINELRQELALLRGLIEDQSFELDRIKAAQRDQYLDLDRRVSALTERGVTRPPVGFPTDPGGAASVPGTDFPVADPGLRADLPEVREPIDAQLETTGLGATPDQNIAPMADPAAEKADYDAAFAALKEGRYAESARLFSSFVERYPNGEYADNAQYWLGESYYVTGNYRIALDAFQKLIGRFPDSTKVPDAKLKLGFTHYELKQWGAAEQMLTEVTRDYPNTTVSRLAENRLRMMRIEGHASSGP